ncbi:MAG: aldehyde ferredoxin oxidoreductase family protein [Proteobacteria bacterium]|nr:aldehyde ferredoxin oxidoreductase family protein [Pseudomonadota bacterium]
MIGWCGKILKIDLGTKRFKTITPDPDILTKFIGGRGLAGYFLKEHITLNWNNPDMPVLLFTGPLANTTSPFSGFINVMSRSPLTGTVGDASVGGDFGSQLKKAGFDGILITGKSDTLCGLEIHNSKINITSASHLAGINTDKTTSLLQDKGSSAVIGPAAENGVLFSNIIFDGNIAGCRNGLGLCFAAKNLKYITVKGTKKTKISDSKELEKSKEDILRLVSASPVLSGNFGISKFGTAALFDLINDRRMLPADNFRHTYFKDAHLLNAPLLKQLYSPKDKGCAECNIMCKKIMPNGTGIPEFETLSHFSALIGNTDIETVISANKFCCESGMDTISAASTLACFSEINEKKLSPSEILKLLSDIAGKKGEGEFLGLGAARYAKMRGCPDTAMAVKNQELSSYDPRGAYGMALAYAVSTRGGCHLSAYPISYEILRKPVAIDRFSFEGKARIIKNSEDINAVIDSLAVCRFVFFSASMEEYAGVFHAVTGINLTANELIKAGERICYNERMTNAANGFSAKDDDLPSRFFNSYGYKGSDINISPIDRKSFLKARTNYYKARGLDKKGLPIAETAKELGL